MNPEAVRLLLADPDRSKIFVNNVLTERVRQVGAHYFCLVVLGEGLEWRGGRGRVGGDHHSVSSPALVISFRRWFSSLAIVDFVYGCDGSPHGYDGIAVCVTRERVPGLAWPGAALA